MLYAATLAAQAVGIAAPVNPALRARADRRADPPDRIPGPGRGRARAGRRSCGSGCSRSPAQAGHDRRPRPAARRRRRRPARPRRRPPTADPDGRVHGGLPRRRRSPGSPPTAWSARTCPRRTISPRSCTPAAPPAPRRSPRTPTPTSSPAAAAIALAAGWRPGRGDARRAAAVPRQRPARHRHRPDVRRRRGWCGPGPLGYRDPDLYARFWKIVEHYRIAAMSAVPTVYGAPDPGPGRRGHQLPARCRSSAPSPLPSSVREAFAAHTGRRLLEGYGLTEATCATTFTPPGEERPGSVGPRPARTSR